MKQIQLVITQFLVILILLAGMSSVASVSS
jgi:hypothetical protein